LADEHQNKRLYEKAIFMNDFLQKYTLSSSWNEIGETQKHKYGISDFILPSKDWKILNIISDFHR
jgi:hypothetical protein